MIRQYISLAAVILIAIFIVTQIEWGRTPAGNFKLLGGGSNDGSGENAKPVDAAVSFRDLRTGGLTRSVRRPESGAVFSPRTNQMQTSAATSTPFSATSTPFQTEAGSQSAYSGVSVEFSNLEKSAGEVKLASSAEAESKLGKASNSPEGINSDIRISGYVLDNSGEPISGLAVTLKLQQASTADTQKLGAQTLNTRSDARGAYSFINLVEGEYQVCTLETTGYKPACQRPRAPNSSADFSLHNVLGGRVYGTVRDEQGERLGEVTISATPGQKNRTLSDKEGRYSLNMTINDKLSYQLYFGKDSYTRERVSVKGREILAVMQLDIVLKKTQYSGFEVRGTIYDQSGAPVSGRTVTLYSPTAKSALALRAASDANGEFTVKYVAAADDYRLTVNTGGAYTFNAAPYASMELFDGMPLLNIQLQSAGSGSFSAYVVSSSGTPIKDVSFSLYSGSAYVGRSISDEGGEIRFEKVPVNPGGSTLRISGGSTPKYTFSGLTLEESEHKSGVELLVDRGDYKLVVVIKDESESPLQGARGVLIWSRTDNGVRSQTMRSQGKVSMAGTGFINFSELGQGAHQLQVRLDDYEPYSTSIDINQQTQIEEIVLVKAE